MGSPGTLTLGSTVTGGTSSIFEDDASQKLATYLRNLQGERGKIEAFKRELPLCMELLDAAIESTKQRVIMDDECSDGSKRTQDFMPLKKRWESSRRSEEKVVLGRPAWMGEAQLWTKHQQQHSSTVEVDFGIDQPAGKGAAAAAPRLLHRQGGAFVPFNRDRQLASPPFSPPTAAAACVVPDAASLSLSTTMSTVPTTTTAATNNNGGDSEENTRVRDSSDARVSVEFAAQTRAAAAQPQRKARRCWSPELHRRFVSALQQLGGSQVATPKQIRELMKVDGLTNDEVKSHLQKYRLHTRRSSPSPSPSSHAPQLLILGWVPPAECTPPAAAAVGAASQASTGGVCNDPTPPSAAAVPLEHTPPQSLRGASPSRRESPHSSSDSYMDESDDEQEEAKSTTSSQKHHQQSHSPPDEKSSEQQVLLQSKGSTTCLPDIDSITRNRSSMGKLQTFRKAKAAA